MIFNKKKGDPVIVYTTFLQVILCPTEKKAYKPRESVYPDHTPFEREIKLFFSSYPLHLPPCHSHSLPPHSPQPLTLPYHPPNLH